MLKQLLGLSLGGRFGLSRDAYKVFREYFDVDYYLRTQPDVRRAGVEPEDHFMEYGWREGRSPSPRFNTIWYLHRYPDVAKSEVNPLIHFAEVGFLEGRLTVPNLESLPDWLADAARNNGLPEQIRKFIREYSVIELSGLFEREFYSRTYQIETGDPIDYFIRHGVAQNHNPNSWFDSAWYRAHYDDVQSTGLAPFTHYLLHGRHQGLRTGARNYAHGAIDEPESRHLVGSEEPSATALKSPNAAAAPVATVISDDMLARLEPEFDESFYRRNNLDLDFSAITPLDHFARFGWREGRDPSTEFSVKGYLQNNPDVRDANMNPLLHYILAGKAENRISRPAQRAPRAADGRSEWLGYDEVCAFAGDSLEGSERDLEALSFCVVLAGSDLEDTVKKLKFRRSVKNKVCVSIVIPCWNEGLVTVECLLSIENAMPIEFDVEVIIVDNASDDNIYGEIKNNGSIVYARMERNIGFGRACNVGASMARGEYVFFLNNDAQIAPGCLQALVAAVEQQGVGLVGPKLMSFDGSLQEAGCLLNRDGTGALIGFGRDHRAPRYNYPRAVEHVSGAAILLRRALFAELGGFDDIFAPAYCEDADLSLKIRRNGLRVVYEPKALVAHHLSKTGNKGTAQNQSKRQRIARNRNVLAQRWADELSANQLRTIAFYLPQYHPIPENDLWWGKGFTEWHNVAKTEPNYVGHNQPRMPADLGYYDLRVPEVMEQQAALARRYGLTGFCYYYYWFDGKRLLEHPIERMLATGKPDLPFCLCWANENWTRRWDGKENDILLGQSYTDEGALEIIADLARYFRAGSYIRIDGRPLVLIYRITELPNPKRMMTMWRNYCLQNGIGQICIAMVESFEFSAAPQDPKIFGCDISVEFPAHGMVHDHARPVSKINFDWTGSTHDYRLLAGAFMKRVEAGFPRIRSVLAGWDSTPRHPNKSLVLEEATPGAFQAWLEWTYRRTLEQNYGDERIVFILAWNEWCEGSYLEPDRHFGHAYLQAVRNALDTVETGGGTFVF